MSPLRKGAPWVALAGAFVAFGLIGGPGAGGPPLDPAATGPQGAKGLVLLLEASGTRVDVTAGTPGPGATTAVVLTDQIDGGRRLAIADWVRRGGTLIVADPTSSLEPGVPVRKRSSVTVGNPRPSGPCAIAGLETIRRLDVGSSLLLRPRPGASPSTCFPDRDRGGGEVFVLSEPVGQGRVVGLGGAGLWTNERLDHEDNAALAVALLASSRPASTALLIPSHAGSGQRSGLDLTSPRFREALVQLLFAFGVLAWWRGRRLGSPVVEAPPVTLAASDLVAAVGSLMARTSSRDAAAHELREATRQAVGERFGLGLAATVEQVAGAAAHRAGLDQSSVVQLLGDGAVRDDRTLVELGHRLAQLRQEVLHGRNP